MERAGERLKRARERLKLTYRDVENASQQVALRRGSDEFAIALSRLADIENKGTVPTIHRIYTLCAIYRLEYEEVLGWYGVPRDDLASESVQISLKETHLMQSLLDGAVTLPLPPHCEIDLDKTTFLSSVIRRWGKAPLTLLNGLDLRVHRYGFIGIDDWSMHPILQPGAFVVIDQNRRKIATTGWTNELDRPIYFFEHRGGYYCGWAALIGGNVLILPHPSSQQSPLEFEFQAEIDVVGQVIGVAMLLESRKRRPHRPSTNGSPI